MGKTAPKHKMLTLSDWLSFLKRGVQRLWQLPDQIAWLSPLPPLHRRCFMIITLVLLLALLWPYSESKENVANNPSATTSNNAVARQNSAQNTPPTNVKNVAPPLPWTRYQIKQGQTLVQLFRVNGLNVNDVFAMAQVEGRDKPLSTLKIGQEVNIQRNQSGQVIALQITAPRNIIIRFQRNADGSFQRLH